MKEEHSKANNESSETPVGTGTTTAVNEAKKTSSLRKWILRIIIALAAILVVIFIVVAFFIGEISKIAINKFGAEILGVDKCHVESIKIYPFCGNVTVKNFEIGKPIAEGAKFSEDLFKMEFLDIGVDVTSLFSKKKIIDHFTLKNLTTMYEKPISGESNVDVLIKNLQKKSDAGTVPAGNDNAQDTSALADVLNKLDFLSKSNKENNVSPGTPEAKGNETQQAKPVEEFYIGARNIDVDGIHTNVYVNMMPIPIPKISFKFEEGLGMDEDLTSTDFGIRIAQRVMNVLHSANFGVVGDAANAAVDVMTGAAGTATDVVTGAAGTATDIVTGAAGTATDAVTGAAGTLIDGVGNIFKKSNDDKKSDEK